jgi:hypothetical protein
MIRHNSRSAKSHARDLPHGEDPSRPRRSCRRWWDCHHQRLPRRHASRRGTRRTTPALWNFGSAYSGFAAAAMALCDRDSRPYGLRIRLRWLDPNLGRLRPQVGSCKKGKCKRPISCWGSPQETLVSEASGTHKTYVAEYSRPPRALLSSSQPMMTPCRPTVQSWQFSQAS